MTDALAAAYVVLASAFLDGRLSIAELGAVILPVFKADTTWRGGEEYHVLNDFFLAVEAYDETPGPYATSVDDVREAALRVVAAAA